MTPLDPFISALAQKLASTILEVVQKSGNNLLKSYSNRRSIHQASKIYAQECVRKYGVLQVLRMQEPLSLNDIYTTTRLIEHSSFSLTTIESLEESFRQTSRAALTNLEKDTIDGFSVVRKCKNITVLGEPGAGKSTFLKRVGLESLKQLNSKQGIFENYYIPVFIELKRLNSSEASLNSLIEDEFKGSGFPEGVEFSKALLEQGKLLLLFDGLDEARIHENYFITDKIQDFVDRYNKNRFIISCRTAAFQTTLKNFNNFLISDFSDTEIEKFITNWFHSDLDREEETAKRFWSLLKTPEYSATKELAHRPLLLTFLCMVYDRSQHLPGKRSILYKRALDILLEEWSADKRITHTEMYRGFDVELEKILLSELAYTSLQCGKVFFGEDEIVRKIKTFVASTLDTPKHLNGKKILEAIAIQQGILVERAKYVYSFSHLTLQEYLAAKYVSQDYRRTTFLVENYIEQEEWREVFLLVSGLIDNSDEFLSMMQHKAQEKILQINKIDSLLNWLSTISIQKNTSWQISIERVFSVYLLIQVISVFKRTFDDRFVSGFSLLQKIKPKFAKA